MLIWIIIQFNMYFKEDVMSYTREEVLEKIVKSFKEQCERTGQKEILLNQVVLHAGFQRDEKEDILKMFCVNKYAELINHNITDLEAYLPVNGRNYIIRRKTNKNAVLENNTNTLESNSDSASYSKSESSCDVPIRERIAKLLEALNVGLYEKKEAVRLALLSAIAGEAIFFIGPPGSAKSKIARKLSHIFKEDGNTRFFEYLMQAFSSPDEIFGPVLLSELEKGDFKRNTKGYLPTAHVAFLDEIWKASPPILNTLLTIINERKFHNGKDVEDVPLKALFAASNETPEADAGLEAIYDRFVMRVPVGFIQNESNFFEMIQAPSHISEELRKEATQYCIDVKEIDFWQKQIDAVQLSDGSLNVIGGIKKALAEKSKKDPHCAISDRRWKNIAHLMKTSAFLNGREATDLMDCQLITYCIWDGMEDIQECEKLVEEMVREEGLEFDTNISDIQEDIEEFNSKISAHWYKEEAIPEQPAEPMLYTDNENEDIKYYKVKNGAGAYFYFKTDFEDENPSCCYDLSFNKVAQARNARFSADKKQITCVSSYAPLIFDVEWSKEVPASSKLVKREDFFDDNVYETILKKFEEDHFLPIQRSIEAELAKIEEYIKNAEVPFKSNLFARQDMCKEIFRKVDAAKKDLEDARVQLGKAKERYKK